MSGINCVKNYEYSILVKKIGVLKRIEKRRKKSVLASTFIHTTPDAVGNFKLPQK